MRVTLQDTVDDAHTGRAQQATSASECKAVFNLVKAVLQT